LAEQQQLKDFYNILEIRQNASDKDVKRAYFSLAKTHHPDRVADKSKKPDAQKRFIEITQAFQVLSDKSRRTAYDSIYAEQFGAQIEEEVEEQQEIVEETFSTTYSVRPSEAERPFDRPERKKAPPPQVVKEPVRDGSKFLRNYLGPNQYFEEGRKLLAGGSYKEAIKILIEAVGRFKSDALLYRTLAIAYHRDGRNKRAVNACNRAIIFESDNYLNYLTMGTLLEGQKDLVTAREYYAQANEFLKLSDYADPNVEKALERVSRKFRLLTHQKVSWPLIVITFAALGLFIYVMTISVI
jgi:tetratricopeptide (TPR) repeat protein